MLGELRSLSMASGGQSVMTTSTLEQLLFSAECWDICK